jgi:glycosyltransferase involved in cell wall biosynthesis
MPKVLVIIPAFNEAGSIQTVIDSVLRADPSWDIVVVNDGSTDNTGAIAARKANIYVINHCANLGIGGAMQSGFKFAFENNYDVAVQCDGDGQHNPTEIKALLETLSCSDNADIIIGSRFVPGGVESTFRSTKARRLGIRFLSLIIRLFTGSRIYDVTSGFRAYNKRALGIVSRHYPTDFPEPEALILYTKTGLKVKEINVSMQPRHFGISSIRGLLSLYYIVKVTVALIIYTLRPAKFITSSID